MNRREVFQAFAGLIGVPAAADLSLRTETLPADPATAVAVISCADCPTSARFEAIGRFWHRATKDTPWRRVPLFIETPDVKFRVERMGERNTS